MLDSIKSFRNSFEAFAIWKATNPKPAIVAESVTTRLIIFIVSCSLRPPKKISRTVRKREKIKSLDVLTHFII